MSADGKTVVIGARNYDNNNVIDAGAARVYSINSTTSMWTQIGSDVIGKDMNDYFGSSVSISADGRIIAIGSAPTNGGTGYVRVYSFNPTLNNWVQIGSDINGKANGDLFGFSIDMSANGTTVAIGAIYNDDGGTDAGHVRVYSISNSMGNIWTQVGSDIVGEAANNYFGSSVSLSDDGRTIGIGGPGNNNVNGIVAGHVRVFSFNSSSNNCAQVGLDIDGEAPIDTSGDSVSISSDGKTIAIGAPLNDNTNYMDTGHVRVYSMNTSVSSNWIQLGSDIDGEPESRAGSSVVVSADGKTVGVGARGYADYTGQVSVYSINPATGNWAQIGSSINGIAKGDSFGRSISMSADGKTIAVGSAANYVRVFIYTVPTNAPTKSPTMRPTKTPTKQPTKLPTKKLTNGPTKSPTKRPTKFPTRSPTKPPTKQPSRSPTKTSSKIPTKLPTKVPSQSPTKSPPTFPYKPPSKMPTKSPAQVPSHNTIPVSFTIPVLVPNEAPVDASMNCGIVEFFNIFCPRRWNCGFWRRLFHIHGC